MRFNTGNPVGTQGSSDPRDLYDNAGIIDLLVNGPLGEYLSRLGVPLRSWLGIMQQVTDFLIDMGYESVYLTYGAGVVVERQTQLVQRNGDLYRVMNAVDVPLTLTGNWTTDAPKLQSVGDAAIRQALANSTDPALGAALVARAIRHVNSVAELRALAGKYDGEVIYLRGRDIANRMGQGNLVWVAGSSLTDNGGTIFGALAGGRWIRPGTDNEILAEWFGCGNDGADYADQVQAAINFAAGAAGAGQGMVVRLPRGVVGASKMLLVPNRVGLQGTNGRGTVLKPLAGFVGQYLISATNGVTSMFASWVRDMYLDCRGVNLTAAVYTTGWQETCNMNNVVISVDGTTSIGILYEVGAGGAALWEVSNCEIFVNSTAATRNGIRVNQVSLVGGFLLIVRNTTITGTTTNQLTRAIYMINDSLHAENLHVEYVQLGIIPGVAGNLLVNGMTGSANAVDTMIAVPSGFLGTWCLNSILPNGATTTFLNNTSGEVITGRIAHYAGPKKAPVSLWTGSLSTGSAVLSRAVQPGELLMFGISAAYAGMQQAAVSAVRGTTFNVSFGSNASAIIAISSDGLTVTVNSITAGFALDRVNVTPNYV
ncbi:hypothetical protein BGP82_06870 [Pseudomonas putida]|uniref:Uncharacterized protein n=1 Tax=Pseudomonas putida TaxID=303 RepID=A0A2S3XEX3_PSEPU|nr:hypothetical protein [Pseudomonas putida]POG14146.1 hypothetical protein BGP82_06870 [Pseudomonas putida]